jgi:hypothetical protein
MASTIANITVSHTQLFITQGQLNNCDCRCVNLAESYAVVGSLMYIYVPTTVEASGQITAKVVSVERQPSNPNVFNYTLGFASGTPVLTQEQVLCFGCS